MSFFIRYDWFSTESGMDIQYLGESLIWFREFSEEIFKAGKISAHLDIKVASIRRGSVIVDIIIEVRKLQELFLSLEDFLYFLQIVAPEYYLQIQGELTKIGGETFRSWQSLESFARDNPVAGWIVWAGI